MELGEVLLAAQAAWGNVISVGALIVTIISGYLVVAYVAGKDMTRTQVIIINTLYVLFMTASLMSGRAFTIRATELMQIAVELSDERLSSPWPDVIYFWRFVYLSAMAASLKFMWDIRHTAKER